MISVTFLGTASGVPEPERFQSCGLIRTSAGHLLLDAGEPCSQQLKNLGISLETIDFVFLTHAHADHVGGLPLLLQMALIEGRRKEMKIFMPLELVAPLRAWLDALYLTESALGFPLFFQPWVDGISAECGVVTVTPVGNTHLAKMGGESFSLILSTAETRIVCSGDLGSAQDLPPLLQQPTDLLICELAHIEHESLPLVLKDAKIEVLCLVHLSPSYSARRAEMQFYFDQNLPGVNAVYIPGDGFVVDL